MRKTINKNIENYVDSFFEGVYYSKEAENAKREIIETLNYEYLEEMEKDKKSAFQVIVRRYPTFDSLIECIDLDKKETDDWFSKKVTTTYESFEKELKKERNHIYVVTLFTIISLIYLLESLLFYEKSFTVLLIFAIVFLIIDIVLIIKHRKNQDKETISVDDEEKLESLFDKYAKKGLVWLFVLFLLVFLNLFDLVTLTINSKSDEIVKGISRIITILEIVLFFRMKNILIFKWLNKRIDFENEKLYKKATFKITITSIIYFLIALGLYYGFEAYFVVNIMAPIVIIYLLYAFFQYFIKSKKFLYNKSGINKLILIPTIIIIIGFAGYSFLSRDIWLVQPYINATPYIYEGNDQITYDDQTGIYTIISNEDDFKILQLTDIHIGGSFISYDKDLKALKAVFALINHAKPDLVIVTGDLTYPLGLSSFSFNNTAPVAQFAAFMRNTGVPWAFTYGNHDTESMAMANTKDLNELYKSLSWKTSRNLLYPYIQPQIDGKNISGRSNQLIEVRNNDGTLNQAIFLIDSNAYVGQGFSKYDYIHNDQVEWYKNEVLRLNMKEEKTISSLGFFHIPLQEYKTAYDLYMSGSDEVKYFFGSNDEKKVSASEFPSKLFDTAKVLGSTKGFFCGHDHYNNMSLEYKGIRLTYGMSIDYLVEPGISRNSKQRGATLIISHKDSSIEIKQIPLSSIEN